jgi:hypothetical protein
MKRRLPLKMISLALALALQIPSQALACRVGVDQQLFEKPPPADALPGAEIIRVRFTNAHAAIGGWPRHVASPDGGGLDYTLIGVARRLDAQASGTKTFPVYAVVTSCSFFWSMSFGEARTVIDGDLCLIGRFASGQRMEHFYAGGRRTHGGRGVYGGFHF